MITGTKPNSTRAALLFSIIFFTAAAFKDITTGQDLYTRNCIHCHGTDGTKGFFGAKNLKTSILPDSAIFLQVQNGKKIMPSFRKRLSADEIKQVLLYVKSLREPK
jgi:mono/diheme cytochrome c family protein